mgnify:CR=1 FL=1
MSDSKDYKAQLLTSWEETYKKGFLTFWLLLSLRDHHLYIDEIKAFIKDITNNTISCEDQSIYRSLRKFYNLEIVDYELRDGNKGPKRKHYFLTELGKELLHDFSQRNISIFLNKKTIDLITNNLPNHENIK